MSHQPKVASNINNLKIRKEENNNSNIINNIDNFNLTKSTSDDNIFINQNYILNPQKIDNFL